MENKRTASVTIQQSEAPPLIGLRHVPSRVDSIIKIVIGPSPISHSICVFW